MTSAYIIYHPVQATWPVREGRSMCLGEYSTETRDSVSLNG
jgi:hypothetical protein